MKRRVKFPIDELLESHFPNLRSQGTIPFIIVARHRTLNRCSRLLGIINEPTEQVCQFHLPYRPASGCN